MIARIVDEVEDLEDRVIHDLVNFDRIEEALIDIEDTEATQDEDSGISKDGIVKEGIEVGIIVDTIKVYVIFRIDDYFLNRFKIRRSI